MRHMIQSVALTLGALAVTLCLAELALRAFAPGEFIPSVERDPILGWRGRPNLSCVYRHSSFALMLPIAQNAGGFRDRDHEIAKPKGVMRVLCLGDSFTWGWGLKEDSIYTHVLEGILKERGARVEVLNAGVQGYNTVQSLLYFKTWGFAYSPDVVVYQASDNDIAGNLPCAPGGVWLYPFAQLREDGGVMIVGTPLPDLTVAGWLKYHAARHSRLFYLLKSRGDSLREARARRAAAVSPSGARGLDDDAIDAPFRLFAALVREMHDECEARGARFVALLDFPLTPHQQECLRRTCGDVEVLSVDRYLSAHEKASGAPAFIPADGHWTESGHRWVAECLADSALGRVRVRTRE